MTMTTHVKQYLHNVGMSPERIAEMEEYHRRYNPFMAMDEACRRQQEDSRIEMWFCEYCRSIMITEHTRCTQCGGPMPAPSTPQPIPARERKLGLGAAWL